MNLQSSPRRFCFLRNTILAVVVIAGHACWSEDARPLGMTSHHGFSQPWELIDVAVSEPGRVEEVMVQEGDVVRENTLIARLDDGVLRASLAIAKQRASAGGEEASARAKLNHAARHRDDIAKLLEESHASQTELDQADLTLRQSEAALIIVQERRDIAKAEVAKIEAELSHREIRSPIDGVVIELNRQKGEYAGGADPVIAKIADLEKLRLRINVPTTVAMQLSVDSTINIEFPEINAYVEGQINFVSPITDSQSGTVRVDVKLDNRHRQLRSGLLGVWRQPLAAKHASLPTMNPNVRLAESIPFNLGITRDLR